MSADKYSKMYGSALFICLVLFLNWMLWRMVLSHLQIRGLNLIFNKYTGCILYLSGSIV